MGTPASIRVFAENGDCLVHIYSQHDGHFDSIGLDVANFLTRITKDGNIDHKQANDGMDLAAQLVLTLKTDSPWGGIYLIPYSEKKQIWDWEYRYDIEIDDANKVWVRAKQNGRSKFAGDVASFLAFCNKEWFDENSCD